LAKRPRKSNKRGSEHGPRVFHVDSTLAKQTLVAALRTLLELPWAEAKRLVKNRHVQINGNLCLDDARRLTTKDVLHVHQHPLATPPKEDDLKIRFIDPHLIVVEKPSGMTTLRHPEERNWPAERRQKQPTLEECLNRVVSKLERNQGRKGSPRVRPVHRLDRDTSGLMVFARTVPAERGLVRQFSKHTITRRYRAVVLGHPAAMVIDSVLVRDRGDGRRGSSSVGESEVDDEGKRAVTHVKPLETLGEYSLVECRLETGRTHQIRIHLSEKGHPVCGEKVYGKAKFGAGSRDPSGAPRLALHAFELGFIHPITQQPIDFEMPFPKDLQVFIDRLRKSAK
jgi:23S rRNA pseudouridine1911/1915/1917 synthase